MKQQRSTDRQCHMERIRHHVEERQRSERLDDSGAAMIMVLIVSAVVMAFCLSLLLVVYTLFAQSSRQTTKLQCRLFAQSFSETLGQELEKPDSDLAVYLSKQITDGCWLSEETAKGLDPDSFPENTVSELVMQLGDEVSVSDYHLTVTLTYSLNVAEDDDTGDTTETDDQDNEAASGGGEESAGEDNPTPPRENDTPGEGGSVPAGNGSYAIRAVITCIRGDSEDRDAPSYTIESLYPAVTLRQ